MSDFHISFMEQNDIQKSAKVLSIAMLNNPHHIDVFLGNGENERLEEACFALSPLVFKKKWTKLELIRLYNCRNNKADENIYSEKSLSAKRFDKILSDITSLLKTT